MTDNEHCASVFLISDTDEKVRTELPNSILAAWAKHWSLKQLEILTDLPKVMYLKEETEMITYTEQSSLTLDTATHLRLCASLRRLCLNMHSPYFIWPFYCVTSGSYYTARVIGRMGYGSTINEPT